MPRSQMALPSLKNIKWVTTDCYGTLIDWEKGIVEACKKEAAKDGFSFEEGPFLARFFEVQAEIMAGSYELYAEVLRRAIVKVAGELGWEIEPSRAQFLPNSVAYWLPFREANAAMDRLGKKYEVGIITNTDDKLLSLNVVIEGTYLLVATAGGYAKRTAIEEYPVQGRGGKGVLTVQFDKRRGSLVGALIVDDDTELYAITSGGGVIRTAARQVRKAGRQTKGVRLMNLGEGDTLVAVARNAEETEADDAEADAT